MKAGSFSLQPPSLLVLKRFVDYTALYYPSKVTATSNILTDISPEMYINGPGHKWLDICFYLLCLLCFLSLQECFTYVLKGHIAVSAAIFPNGTKGWGFKKKYFFFLLSSIKVISSSCDDVIFINRSWKDIFRALSPRDWKSRLC